METTAPASRWVCLLALAVVMLLSAPQDFTEDISKIWSLNIRGTTTVDSFILISCCFGGRSSIKGEIEQCYHQKSGHGCSLDAYMVRSEGKWRCIRANSQWLKQKLQEEKLNCPAILGIWKRGFEDVAA